MAEKTSVGECKPEPYALFRVWISDDETVAAVWTGKVRWSNGEEIFPTHWAHLVASGSVFRGGTKE